MQILCVDNINFKAGKVHFFSDFDGTYLAEKHSDIKSGLKVPELRAYADRMDKFFKSTDNHLDFHITTGRKTFDSYYDVSELFKRKNIHLPLPDSFIIDNGYIEYKITNKNHNFYNDGIFPYDESKPIKRPHGAEKSKAYHPKSMLENTIQNNDIIIVAGNGGNDRELLNPLRYIDFSEYKAKSANKSFYEKTTEEMLVDLKAVLEGKNTSYINSLREELQSNGLLAKIKELPVYSIVVKDPNKDIPDPIKAVTDVFSSQGKVIQVKRGELDKALKKIIKMHGEKSKEFKNGMSKKFRESIFGKTASLMKKGVIFGIITALSGIFMIIYHNKSTPNSEKGS